MSDIANDVNIDKSQVYQQELIEAANNTLRAREQINILFSNDTLFDSSTT
jgi:hypothetical protein